MRIPRRAPKVPADVAAGLGLDGARVLAWSPLAGGGAAAATVAGLHVMTPRGEQIVRGWLEVDRAAFDNESGTLGVWWIGTRSSTALELEDDSRFPVVVRERVQASVVLTGLVPVGEREVRIALRRTPEGAMTTQVVAPPGVDVSSPSVAARIAEALADLSAEAGVGPGDVWSDHAPGFGTL